MMTRRCCFSVLLLMTLQGGAHAQAQEQNAKFRLAQSYEQVGNIEAAVKLYEEVLARDATNLATLEALNRLYLQLKRYDDAITLLQRRLVASPADVRLRATLGSIYYKAGKEQEATAVWEEAIGTQPSTPAVYQAIAAVMMENRLLDRTADLYRRARVSCKDPTLFTLDLAQLLAVSMDYGGATSELLRWLELNPTQLGFVQSRMATFTGKPEARQAAIEVVQSEIRKSNDIRFLDLLAWLHLEGKDFNAAFDVYRRIDAVSKGKGEALYAFADRAFKERAFDVAASAYLEAINIPVSAVRLPHAKYGYATALKELSVASDTLTHSVVTGHAPATESQPSYAGAIAYFRQIISEYPRSEFSAKSYYQIGTMLFEKYFDLDGALQSYESVERELPGLPLLRFDVALKIAEVLTAKGDTAGAALHLSTVVNAPNALPDQHDEASYRLAELEYFGGNFSSATVRLEGISANLQANFANDALGLQVFLQENKTTAEAALKQFARADFLARQRHYPEAIALFLRVIEQYPQTLLVDDALMKTASLQAKAGLYTDAIASYERLLAQFKESSIALDRAQFNIGDVYQYGLHDKNRALEAYEKLLADYPQSLLTTQARRRIRELRGDAL
jgi:cellulose synthase operon protein C